MRRRIEPQVLSPATRRYSSGDCIVNHSSGVPPADMVRGVFRATLTLPFTLVRWPAKPRALRQAPV